MVTEDIEELTENEKNYLKSIEGIESNYNQEELAQAAFDAAFEFGFDKKYDVEGDIVSEKIKKLSEGDFQTLMREIEESNQKRIETRNLDIDKRLRKLEAVERMLKQIEQGIMREKELIKEAKKMQIDRYSAIISFAWDEPNLKWETMLEDLSVLVSSC